jgi:putative endonuclease
MSKFFNKITGLKGEKLAIKYLKNNNYKIIDTNYTTKIGEVDIIAKKDTQTVFVEVKTRSTKKFGNPSEAVTKHKQNKIRQVSTQYLKANKQLNDSCRCDVIEVLNGDINHIKNAF